MLILHQSRIETVADGMVRLIMPVTESTPEGSVTHDVWVEVDKCYEKYLCSERNDAILLGMLYYALKNGHDIKSEIPVSRELYFNLTNLFIPALSAKEKGCFKRISLQMETTAEALPNAGAVGTGVSLGVDSFYTIARHGKGSSSLYPVTHLLYFNVGSHGRADKAKLFHEKHRGKVMRFAREYDYNLVTLNSNFGDEFSQHYCDMHVFAAALAVFSLQKLWGNYLYASAGFPSISVTFPPEKGCSCDALMPMINGAFATENLRFRADAECVNRFDKIVYLSQNEMAQKYLTVCTRGAENCCRCEKCVRTILRLRICGAFDKFSTAFASEKCSLFHEIYLILRKALRRSPRPIISDYFNFRKSKKSRQKNL